MNELTHGKPKRDTLTISWTEGTVKAFEITKKNLAAAVQLVHPDPHAEMSIASDASDITMGAVLQQKISNNWYPLSFFSKTFNKA